MVCLFVHKLVAEANLAILQMLEVLRSNDHVNVLADLNMRSGAAHDESTLRSAAVELKVKRGRRIKECISLFRFQCSY